MPNIERVKQFTELEKCVKELSRRFPECSITANLDKYLTGDSRDNGSVIIVVMGVDESDVEDCISDIIPGFTIEAAGNYYFNIYPVCYEDKPDPHNLREIWGC